MNCIMDSRPDAIAQIRGENGSDFMGEARFFQRQNGVLISVNVSGLPADSPTGFYALHIHEGGSCEGKQFEQSGGHYNPEGVQHPRHAGDLPPLLGTQTGAWMSVLTDRFRVRDVIGQTIIIHHDADDFHTQPSGNAGEKIACGVIAEV